MSSSCNNLIATGTEEGYIVIWTIFPTLKVSQKVLLENVSCRHAILLDGFQFCIYLILLEK